MTNSPTATATAASSPPDDTPRHAPPTRRHVLRALALGGATLVVAGTGALGQSTTLQP